MNPQAIAAYNAGNAALREGRAAEARKLQARAVALAPDFADAHNNLGIALSQLGEYAAALPHFAAMLAVRPDHVGALHLRGRCLRFLRRFEDARRDLRAAYDLAPGAGIATDLALVCRELLAFDEALALLRATVAARPDSTAAWSNLCNGLSDLGLSAEAQAAGERALALSPGDANARYNLACAKLDRGDWPAAWPLYEARWQALYGGAPRFPAPPWRGEPVRTLFLHAEQGHGDTLQFCRYAKLAAQKSGARVVLEVQPALRRLLAGLRGVDQLIVQGDPVPDFDAHCPLMSLPLAFGTSLSSVPPAPYLQADPQAVAGWRARLAGLRGRRVGLVWAGEAGFAHDAQRSLPASALAPLAGFSGIDWVSLQLGRDARPALKMVDYTTELADFAGTAALIMALDLVIAADTAVCHLAGALGQKTWLMNRTPSDWRWLRGREDTPWYPSMRVFRQATPGDWSSVIAQIGTELGGESRI